MCIIGCNTIGHLCAGFFEIHRGGDDTSGREWERTKKMGVNTLAFRGIQDKAFFHMDADCVGVTTQIPWEKNKQWLEAVALSGTPLFLACEHEAITPEIFEDLKKAFQTTYHTQQQVIVIPNNWEQELTPKQWIFNQKKIEFDW